MGVLKYELKKLFLNKIAIALILAFTLIPAVINYLNEVDYSKKVTSFKELYELEKNYEGKIDKKYFEDNEEKLELIKNKAAFQIENKEEQFYFDYYNAIKILNAYEGNADVKGDSLSGLEKELIELKNKGEEDTYYYKNTEKKYNMLKSLDEPEFYFAKGWSDLFSQSSKTNNIFIGLIIILLISMIFSNEYSTKMDSLIFSSKLGRSKIVKTKLMAALIFSVSIVLLFNIVQLLSFIIPTSIAGWDTPIRSQIDFLYSPYNFTMIQYFGISIMCQIIGAIALSFIGTFISSLFKSSIVSFFITFCIYLSPFIAMMLGLNKIKIVDIITNVTTVKLMGCYDVFKNYYCFNIFGIPVLNIYIILFVSIILTLACAIFTRKVITRIDAS